ncbi:MAG: hypothetical protein LAN64_20460, partial [Acidobacteriia bacterium]|nr:hypothetical protein [Terriglobia bacterium]
QPTATPPTDQVPLASCSLVGSYPSISLDIPPSPATCFALKYRQNAQKQQVPRAQSGRSE